jgi:type IV secretion system protein VirD4
MNRKARRRARRILGLTFDGRPIFEPANAGCSIVYAAAGGGKTTCAALPSILSMLADEDCAQFINDVKSGEIASQIAPVCAKYGRKFAIVDEFGERPDLAGYKISLNPFGDLAGLQDAGALDLPFLIETIAHALIEEPKDDAKNFYWRESPRSLIETSINLLLSQSSRFAFPGGVHALLSDPHMFKSALEIAAEEGDDALKAASSQILEMREKNPEHYAQHLGTALTALKHFAVAPLKDAGRTAHLTQAQLISEGWIVCFINPARFADRLGSFYALHFLALLNAKLAGAPGRMELILDEVCNAPLKDALNRVTIQRAYGVRSHFLAQARLDVVRRYGEKETAILEENCTVKQYLKFSNYEEAERISRAIGVRPSVSMGLGFSSDKDAFTGNYSTGKDRHFSADELMRLRDDEQILHVAGVGFIHCRKIRQNQLDPYCFDLGDNPLEGSRLPPDPRVVLLTPPVWEDRR